MVFFLFWAGLTSIFNLEHQSIPNKIYTYDIIHINNRGVSDVYLFMKIC